MAERKRGRLPKPQKLMEQLTEMKRQMDELKEEEENKRKRLHEEMEEEMKKKEKQIEELKEKERKEEEAASRQVSEVMSREWEKEKADLLSQLDAMTKKTQTLVEDVHQEVRKSAKKPAGAYRRTTTTQKTVTESKSSSGSEGNEPGSPVMVSTRTGMTRETTSSSSVIVLTPGEKRPVSQRFASIFSSEEDEEEEEDEKTKPTGKKQKKTKTSEPDDQTALRLQIKALRHRIQQLEQDSKPIHKDWEGDARTAIEDGSSGVAQPKTPAKRQLQVINTILVEYGGINAFVEQFERMEKFKKRFEHMQPYFKSVITALDPLMNHLTEKHTGKSGQPIASKLKCTDCRRHIRTLDSFYDVFSSQGDEDTVEEEDSE